METKPEDRDRAEILRLMRMGREMALPGDLYAETEDDGAAVLINLGGSRALKFLPNGYTPVAEEQMKQMRAEIGALNTQLHRGAEQLGAAEWQRAKYEAATLLEKKAKYEAATAASEASMKIIEDRLDDLDRSSDDPDPSGARHVLRLLDKLDEAARGAGEAAAPSHEGASGSTGWRHASVEDYGRAMRSALEELAESDRRQIERGRRERNKLLEGLERLRQEHDKRTAEHFFHLENELAADRLKLRR